MVRTLPLALALLTTSAVSAQGVIGEDGVYVLAEEAPQPVGGLPALHANLVYPEAALAAHAEGTVVVTFIVQADGTLRDVAVQRAPHPSLGEATLAALTETPYSPGLVGGDPVDTRVSLPVRFTLPSAAPEPAVDAALASMPPRPEGGWERLWRRIDWPDDAARSGVEGVFIIVVDVDTEGNVSHAEIADAEVARNDGMVEAIGRPRRDPAGYLRNVDRRPSVSSIQNAMEQAILRTIETTRFIPGVRDGEVVAARVTQTLEYYLNR